MRTFVEFVPIIIFVVAAIALVVVVLILSALLRPHVHQSETKLGPYECGEEPIGEARMNFPYSYYVYTIIFAVIDVLSALLFMFAVAFHAPEGSLRFSVSLVIQVFILVGMLVVGLVYGLSKVSEVMLSGTEILELRRASKKA
ncbi:MAG: NADH-quinone oxidoreductase subunit A [Candidatus Heimdallarchaeota archaeon]